MTYDEKKIKLTRYLITVERLRARCRESERWQPLASGGMLHETRRTARSTAGLDALAVGAETVRQEIEVLAGQVNRLRRELTDAIACMPTERYRTILDLVYISGLPMAEVALQLNYAPRTCRRLLGSAIDELATSSSYFSSGS